MAAQNSLRTLIVEEMPNAIKVTFNRAEQKNTLSSDFIQELFEVFSIVEKNPSVKVVILRGSQGVFCTGMDFHEALVNSTNNSSHENQSALAYMKLLKKIATLPKVVIAEVDGVAMAGGLGLVVASDLVITTPKSQFSLSEALWGLLPANLLPYLIRRVGFQKAYMLTMTSISISGEEAKAINLADEVTHNLDDILRKYLIRFNHLATETIDDIKKYFRKLWIINEEMEHLAVNELTRLIQSPRVINNIKRFVEEQKFPWESP